MPKPPSSPPPHRRSRADPRGYGIWPARDAEAQHDAAVRIGCAGWSIPRHAASSFGEGSSQLARYATRLSVVEINSSFYRPHRTETYQRWAASVPEHFRFSVKMPRTTSHVQGLRGCGSLLDAFLPAVGGLGSKLGGLLLQLPPSLVADSRVASTFFRVLRARTDAQIACEPRHPSWFAPRMRALFERYGVSRVIADPVPANVAEHDQEDWIGPWLYRRLHGSPRIYYSEYATETLQSLADTIESEQRPSASWVIFDNTAHGFSLPNALRLQQMMVATASSGKQRA